jgi:hypothetical protein
MPLKRNTVLSREDFREALDSHQISISQVAKATDTPRSYLSEFLSIGRPLKPEQLRDIRKYLEDQGVEFDDEAADGVGEELPHPSLAIANICHFPVHPARVQNARTVLDEIEHNDARIAELLDMPVERKGALPWSRANGEFTASTVDILRELFALAGANYFLFRSLTGVKNPLAQSSSDSQEKISAAVASIIKESLDRAQIETTPEPAPNAEPEEEGA